MGFAMEYPAMPKQKALEVLTISLEHFHRRDA